MTISTRVSRILPPRLFLLLAVATCTVGWLLPGLRWIAPPSSLAGAVLVVAGLGVAVAGSRTFDRAGTNIKTFDAPDVLVTHGWFARSRNPMYLGFLVALLGLAVAVGSLTALLGPTTFFLVAHLHYVPYEEKRLRATFGADYDQYARRVRRWI